MIRLATQFDRASARPVVAAPKSHGCCCCCCCCIVTVITGSILTARATSRALRGMPSPPVKTPPSATAADGWGNPPVGPAAPVAAAVDSTTETKPEAPAPPASVKRWIAVAAALIPVTLCVIPSLIGGVAYFFENIVRGEQLYDLPGWVGTGLTGALFVALLVAMRRYAKLGALGIALMTAPMIALGALAFIDDAWFIPPIGLMVLTWIGGLVALARRGVPSLYVALAGVLVPIALAVEFGAWLGLLMLTVMR